MRTIKTYSKGAPFYNASASRNVAETALSDLTVLGVVKIVVTV
jgi:hypothetical protein